MRMNTCKKVVLIGYFLLATLIYGCWNYREIESFIIVSGFAVDINDEDSDNRYKMTVETVNTAAEAAFEGLTLSTAGRNMFECIRDFIIKSSKRLYWGDAMVFIISEAVAKEGLIPVLDIIYRDAELRDDTKLLISGAPTAGEILENERTTTAKINAFHIDDIIEGMSNANREQGATLWGTAKILYEEGISPAIPIVRLSENYNNPDKKDIQISGLAVFEGDRMAGILTEEETKYYYLLMNQLKKGYFTIHSDSSGESVELSFEMIRGKVKVLPQHQQGKIAMNLEIQLEGKIIEAGISGMIMNNQVFEQLEEDGEKQISKAILEMIHKVQKTYQSDIFGYGLAFKDKYSKLWKEIQPDWEHYFYDMDIHVLVRLNIKNSGLRNESVDIQ